MLKMKKLTLAIAMATALAGCANIGDSYKASQQDYQNYAEITKQFNVKENWWALYNDSQLNRVVEQALVNNKDLAKASVAVNRALYNANLAGANLIPAFSGSTQSSASKNVKTGGSSAVSHQGALNVSYTLDLWQRLANTADAAEWSHKATAEDLEATKLSLINSVVTTYYQIAYLNDAISTTEETIKYYNDISSIMQRRLSQGVTDSASVDQAQQAVLTARNNLINYQTQRKTAEQTLRNLLNLKPEEALNINFPHILNVKNVGVNLNVPVSVIANRPDVKGYQYRLGLIGSSLPSLNWNTVKWNVKISEADYETARLNYEQSITKALNDVDTNYFTYTQAQSAFANLQKTHSYNQRITKYYRDRYNAGVSELREWLAAANTEKSSQLSILNAKYNIIQAENAVYSSMAGYYSR